MVHTLRHVYMLTGWTECTLVSFHEKKEAAEINGSGATFVRVCLCVCNTSGQSGDIKGAWQDVDWIFFCYYSMIHWFENFWLRIGIFSQKDDCY